MNARTIDPCRAQRELLSHSQLLAGLPEKILEPLILASRVVHLASNQPLFKAGDPIREAYMLFSGSVQRSVLLPSGENKIISLLQTEQMISPGELFSANSYGSSCTTMAKSLLVAIEIRALQKAIQGNSELSYRIITALARQQCATEFDVTGFHHGLTGTQRLLDYLLELAGERLELAGETTVQFNASKRVIAARIGMSPESLSRNLRELSELGVIVVDGRNVHIQNAALQDTLSDAKQRLKFRRKRKGIVQHRIELLPPGSVVNMAGRLRVLSQRMAVAWGVLFHDIDPGRTRIRLRQFESVFNRCLGQLHKLPLAQDAQAYLASIETLWPDYQAALHSEKIDIESAGKVFVLSEQMLDATDRLTACCAHNTGTPMAIYVHQSGRNRMLTQRIAKFFLFQDYDDLQARLPALLEPARNEFERNLQELTQVGQAHPELTAQAKVIATQWQKFLSSLNPGLLQGGPAKHARKVQFESEKMLRCVETMVNLFERLTGKPQDDTPPASD